MTTRTHFRACNLCEAMCGLRIEAEGDRVTSIRGDEEDPLSRGYLCPKAFALKDLHEDPDRLRTPMRRVGAGESARWEPLGWDEALDEAARGLSRAQAAHGRDAVGTYLGNPNVHNTGAVLFAPMFGRALRTKNRFSATSVDQLPSMLASYWMLGHQLLLPVPDVDRTAHFLILGANPLASNGSLMTAPNMKGRIDAILARGGRVVVIDPRRTETAARADEHVFIRPGTDALLLLAMLHVVLEKKPSMGRLAAFTDGIDELEKAAKDATPERAAAPTGIPAATIRRLAEDFARAPSAVAYGRVGTSTQPFGTLCQWLINALNIVTGNFDREGGAMFPKPALDPLLLASGLGVPRGSYGRWKSRVRGLPEFAGELPVAALAEEILTPGEGRIRALVTIAGNPVLSTPNGGRLDEALASLDFMIAIDPYLNETTRHANLILPPPSPLERIHYDVVFHLLAVHETARFAPALFDKGPDARHDWQILLGLARRIEAAKGTRRGFQSALKLRALEALGPETILDVGLRLGPHGPRLSPPRVGMSLRKLKKAPHGVDLGPLTASLPKRLFTKEKRIRLAPPPLLEDLARLWKAFPARESVEGENGKGLLLVGRRHLRDNNSWMHNSKQLMAGKPRCTLFINPEDATRLGLTTGGEALVRSRVGEVKVPITVTDDMMPGVVSLPHGYGHARSGVKLGVAAAHAGVSINDLTDEQVLDDLSGNAAFSGVEVTVEAAPARA
ncbi:MAG: Oxidoreductase, molybdopterin-binding protein [Myxococcaceae bacterium]|nr:Oxidoreductase, molybdopterin-binding protein [Myxococcaceae bacterium]